MALVTPRIFWPVVIDSTNDTIAFNGRRVGAGANSDYTCLTIANATYTDPETLLAAIQTAINGATRGGGSFAGDSLAATVSMTSIGFVTITITGLENGDYGASTAVFGGADAALLFPLLGYTAVPDETGTIAGNTWAPAATTQMPHLWTPRTSTATAAVRSDSLDRNRRHPTLVETAGGQSKTVLWGSALIERLVKLEYLPPHKVFTARESTYVNQAIERMITDEATGKFRYWPDDATLGTYGDYYLTAQTIDAIPKAQRMFDGLDVYALDLDMRGYNA